jgi:hypothetical protein
MGHWCNLVRLVGLEMVSVGRRNHFDVDNPGPILTPKAEPASVRVILLWLFDVNSATDE